MEKPFDGLYFTINGFHINIQQAVIHWLVILIFIGIALIVIGNKIKKADPAKPPRGVVLIAEIYGNFIEKFVISNAGKYNVGLVPYIGTLALMLLFSNTIGLLGFQPPTTNLGLNATLALITFFLIHYRGIRKNGWGHFSGWFYPHWLLFPVNVFGELALPVSLSVRLFANILSGSIIMYLVYLMWFVLAKVFLPSAIIVNIVAPMLHIYFDIFSGFIQTYVFTTITLFFIGQATSE